MEIRGRSLVTLSHVGLSGVCEIWVEINFSE